MNNKELQDLISIREDYYKEAMKAKEPTKNNLLWITNSLDTFIYQQHLKLNNPEEYGRINNANIHIQVNKDEK